MDRNHLPSPEEIEGELIGKWGQLREKTITLCLLRRSKILTYPMENPSPGPHDDGPRKEYLSIEEAVRFLNSIDILKET